MTTTTSTWLDPIPGLWRDEAAHRYWLGDHLFPVSITGVLAHGLSETAKRSIEAKRPIWEPRGTTVHAALEHYSQARFLVGKSPGDALLEVETLPGHYPYRDWILPLLQLPLWDEVQVLYDLKTLSAHGRPYSTAAQLGGYMVLEAAQGNHYELGQTIWSKPGEAFCSTFYSREQCLAAWAAAWSRYCQARRPF